MGSNDRTDELARRERERFETSVHTLAVVALAKEIYCHTDRTRLLTEYANLIAAHDAAVNAADVNRLPDTAPVEERAAQAKVVVSRVREASQAINAFGNKHPLIKTIHWQIKTLTRSLND